MYHLTSLGDMLSDGGVSLVGCFQRSSLYRYVVAYNTSEAAFSYGEYKLFVNGRQIVDGNTTMYPDIFTEFYFYGNERNCPSGGVHFTLNLQFDSYPRDISWELENLDDITAPVFFSDQTTGFPDGGYGAEFINDTLHVDHCILSDVRYRFTLADSFGEFDPPGYYEIASNGTVIKRGAGFVSSFSSTDFYSNGAIILPPSGAPTSPFPSRAPTPNPTSTPTTTPLPTTEIPPTAMPSVPTMAPSPFPLFFEPPTSGFETRTPTEEPAGRPVSIPDDPPPPPPPFPLLCFVGSTTVEVKSKGRTKMKDLQIGDEIAVGKEGVYEAVYSFGHYEPQGAATILEIETSHHPILRISHQHLVFVKRNGDIVNAVPASVVSVGDALVAFDSDGKSGEIVKSVTPVFRSDGLYAPFTASGKLSVNGGLLVSSFVALNKEEVVSVLGVDFTHQWLAHSFEFPHRFVCNYMDTKWCGGNVHTCRRHFHVGSLPPGSGSVVV